MEPPATNQMTVAIFAGGSLSDTVTITPSDAVIAADSGYDTARSRGVNVDLLVGDLDSISGDGLREAISLEIPTERHPIDKNTSDLELALEAAVTMGATDVTMYGGEGGRLDHLLCVALGLSADSWRGVNLVWEVHRSTIYRVLPELPITIAAPSGTNVTLLPVGDAAGVTTQGLRWPLANATLARGTSLGLSNTSNDSVVSVSLAHGALLAIFSTNETGAPQ